MNPDASLTTYAYDGNGNRTGEVSVAGITTYTWDGENRLLSVQEPSGTTSYTYGGDGLRRSTSDVSGTKLFLWDGPNLLLEKDASLDTQSLYLGVPDTYQSLLLMRQGSDWFFPAFDTQGSVRNLIAAGDVISDSYRYSAYGLLLAASDSTYNPRRFLGEWGYYFDGRDLFYLRNRELDSVTGRFLSRDPMGFDAGDVNLYRYVGNNAANRVDPLGLWTCILGWTCNSWGCPISPPGQTFWCQYQAMIDRGWPADTACKVSKNSSNSYILCPLVGPTPKPRPKPPIPPICPVVPIGFTYPDCMTKTNVFEFNGNVGYDGIQELICKAIKGKTCAKLAATNDAGEYVFCEDIGGSYNTAAPTLCVQMINLLCELGEDNETLIKRIPGGMR